MKIFYLFLENPLEGARPAELEVGKAGKGLTLAAEVDGVKLKPLSDDNPKLFEMGEE
jgi:hypothetical protein